MKKVLLVTGGSRGIGAAICRSAARDGYAVAVNFRANAEAAERLVEEIRASGQEAIAVRADVGVETEVDPMMSRVENELGPITALVNNAGLIGRASPFIDADMDLIRQVIDVDLAGVMLCTQAALRRMARSRYGNGGSIVNISSCAATLGASGEFVWYAAAKAAVDIFTVGVAREVASEGIRVNAVAPGMVDTEIHLDSGAAERIKLITPTVPMARMADPVEIAEPVLFLLSEAASYITGAVLRVGGGR